MAPRERPRRAAGTRGARDLIRSLGRQPSNSDRDGDISAVRGGEVRIVSCAIRGSTDPYPKGFRHGVLELTGGGARWKPYWWSFRREPIAIDADCVTLKPRDRNRRTDWNIKSGGIHRPDGILPSSGFTVLVCTNPRGWREFAVPTFDVPVVKAFFDKTPR